MGPHWDPTVTSACLGTVRLVGVEMKSCVLAKENCNKNQGESYTIFHSGYAGSFKSDER